MKFTDYTKPLEKFPTKEGTLILPISLSKVQNEQEAEIVRDMLYDCLSKIKKPGVSASVVYTTSLYWKCNWDHSKRERITENYHRQLINSLEQSTNNPIAINMQYLQFINRSQLRLFSNIDFDSKFKQLQEIFDKDTEFQDHMKTDAQDFWRDLSPEQRDFFLEEHLMSTLVSKNKIIVSQPLVPNPKRQLRWYPWAPLRHQVYMMQKNIGAWNPDFNKLTQQYEYSRYDYKDKLLYDMSKINLDSYKREIDI